MSDVKQILHDTGSVEKIAGVEYAMASPSVIHHDIVWEIAGQFREYFKGKTCKPFLSPVDVFLGDNILVPDLFVVCDKSIIQNDGVHGAPDLVVEVLSPSTADRDLNIKRWLYRQAGVKEYWIVDDGRFVRWDFNNGNDAVSLGGRSVESVVFPGLVVELPKPAI